VRQAGDQIAVWLRTGKEAVVERVKQDLIKLLNLPENIRLDFDLFFKDEAKLPGASAGPRPTQSQKPPGSGPGTGYRGGYGGPQGERKQYPPK
jgi:hypothetical protein